jgi:hypothetical protein
MDILGAVASAVQLASLCYSVADHLAQLPEDQRLLASLEAQIVRIDAEINTRLPLFCADSRVATQDLSKRLVEITTKITSFRAQKRFILFKGLRRVRAGGVWQEVVLALQMFHFQSGDG